MSKTKLVAIVNVTPDSFSDGGKYFRPEEAVKVIEQHIADGADIIDIGAESTRPGAIPLTSDEEWQRLEPVFKILPMGTFSLDTRHAETARKALDYGIDWINDVSGFSDMVMLDTVKNSDCKLVVMHSLSIPADKNIVMPESVDVVQEIMEFAKKRIGEMASAGIARDRIIFDPGIGFGKTARQSWAIIDSTEHFSILGVPLLIGHSRKSFLSDRPGESRDEQTLAVSQTLVKRGVAYLRVHDVAAHKRMLAHAN